MRYRYIKNTTPKQIFAGCPYNYEAHKKRVDQYEKNGIKGYFERDDDDYHKSRLERCYGLGV